MANLPNDTHPEIERVQIELLKKASISQRFALTSAWSEFIRNVAKTDIRRLHPEASEEEVMLMLAARLYGQELADKVRQFMQQRQQR